MRVVVQDRLDELSLRSPRGGEVFPVQKRTAFVDVMMSVWEFDMDLVKIWVVCNCLDPCRVRNYLPVNQLKSF